MAMHFFNPTAPRGPEISLLLSRRGKFHLDPHTSQSIFHDTPKTTFIATQLRSSVWQPQSAPLHMVRNNGDLRSKDLAGIPLETNWWHILDNYLRSVSKWVNPTPCSLTCVHIIDLISPYLWSVKHDHQSIHVLVYKPLLFLTIAKTRDHFEQQ